VGSSRSGKKHHGKNHRKKSRKKSWWSVRSVCRTENEGGGGKWSYEERITLWRARSRLSAVTHAAKESRAYSGTVGGHDRNLCHSMRISDDIQRNGCEIFVFGRADKRDIDDYVDRLLRTHSSDDVDMDSDEYKRGLEEYDHNSDLERSIDIDWRWWSVRSTYRSRSRRDGSFLYIERVTLWNTSSGDVALDLAAREAEEYSRRTGFIDSGYYSAAGLEENPRINGGEVFNEIRLDDRDFKRYMRRYISTGREFITDSL
jgi:hypothetical protein